MINCLVYSGSFSNPWLLSAIYGPPKVSNRAAFWESINSILKNYDCPWLLVGDLNSTMSDDERFRPRDLRSSQRACQGLRNVVTNLGLIDLGSIGGKFSWQNRRLGLVHARARFDRALCDVKWQSLFPHLVVFLLPATISDHNPLLLDTNQQDKTPRPFKFKTAWTCDHRSTLVIQKTWQSYSHSLPGRQLIGRLNTTKKALLLWNKK